jgi:hypothetical protein
MHCTLVVPNKQVPHRKARKHALTNIAIADGVALLCMRDLEGPHRQLLDEKLLGSNRAP